MGATLFLPNYYYPEPVLQALEKTLGAVRINPSSIPEEKRVLPPFSLGKARLILMSSATTKKPKFLSIPFYSLFYNALSCVEKLKLEEPDLYLLSLPLFHVSGLAILMRTFLQKASLLFSSEKSFLYRSSRHTHTSLVPTQLYRLLRSDSLTSWKKSIKTILIGGDFCPKTLYEEGKEKGLPLFLSYGMSEMGSQILMANNPLWKDGLPFLGFTSSFQKACLSKEQELLLKGITSFEKYFFQESPFTKEGWFATKDLALYDPKYGYAILGRKDRMFISGGENIYPEEIERTLLSLQGVQKAYVTCQKDLQMGHVPIAFVKTTEKIPTLVSRLKNVLPFYKIPVQFFSQFPSFLPEQASQKESF